MDTMQETASWLNIVQDVENPLIVEDQPTVEDLSIVGDPPIVEDLSFVEDLSIVAEVCVADNAVGIAVDPE